jgi:hypothetical protein
VRNAIGLACLVITALCVCVAHAAPVPIEDEEYAVLSAALSAETWFLGESPLVIRARPDGLSELDDVVGLGILDEETFQFTPEGHGRVGGRVLVLRPSDPSPESTAQVRYRHLVDPSIIADLRRRSDLSPAFEPRFEVPWTYTMLPASQEARYRARGRSRQWDWAAFGRDFGQEAARVDLSRVGFSPAGDEAFVHVVCSRGHLNATGMIVVLTRIDGHWHVTNILRRWIS